jgi:hypothetical protein
MPTKDRRTSRGRQRPGRRHSRPRQAGINRPGGIARCKDAFPIFGDGHRLNRHVRQTSETVTEGIGLLVNPARSWFGPAAFHRFRPRSAWRPALATGF